MDNKILNECLELLNAKPRPKWGKLKATLKVNNVKFIAGRNWRQYDDRGIALLLEIESLKQPKPKAKKKVKKDANL